MKQLYEKIIDLIRSELPASKEILHCEMHEDTEINPEGCSHEITIRLKIGWEKTK